MIERLERLKEFTRRREFRQYRSTAPQRQISCWGSEQRKQAMLFVERCRDENPIVLADERIAFMRSRNSLDSFASLRRFTIRWLVYNLCGLPKRIRHFWHRLGHNDDGSRTVRSLIYNTTANYAQIMRHGFTGRIEFAKNQMRSAHCVKEREFLECAIITMEALLELSSRYAAEAERQGNKEVASILRHVPSQPPSSFHEALQFLRICNFSQYLAGMAHCGLGRMDQYLWPYYKNDVSSEKLTRSEAAELLAEFFISLNRDSDLYPGIQQGDNGQSVMLGGCDPVTGASAVNDLTYLILEVSCDVRLIDPKINLRIDRNTPIGLLELGSELTACGLGFPQYSNDEVVIPALVKKGYALEDARDYSVAACWEFVIPGRAADFVNAGAVSFPYAVDQALRKSVERGQFDEKCFKDDISASIFAQIDKILKWNKKEYIPHPYLSVLFDGALEARRDFTECAKYKFVGIHGAGSANAADAMSAVLEIFKNRGLEGLKELVAAQDKNFDGNGALRDWLVNEAPKVGTSNDKADDALKFLFDAYAAEADKFHDLRPGSGSAMFYVWLTNAEKRPQSCVEPLVGATSDGRLLGCPLGASLAPSHEAKVRGVMSVFRSFANIDYSRIVNGGPVTIELSHSVFDSPDGTKKLGQLIQYFVSLGGQQLQLNVLDVAELEDAVKHPELHRNLIVRVWGWSGYFCELAPEYQQQIIRRHRYG